MRAIIRMLAAAALLAWVSSAGASFISYTLTVNTLTDSPSTFTLSLTKPIAPQSGPQSYTFSGSFELTDLRGDGVTLSLGNLPEFWRLEAADAGNVFATVDDVGGTVDLLGPGTFAFTASGPFDCGLVCTALRPTVSFTLSGNDQASSTGTYTLLPSAVPEPGTLALLAACAIALVAAPASLATRPTFRRRTRLHPALAERRGRR